MQILKLVSHHQPLAERAPTYYARLCAYCVLHMGASNGEHHLVSLNASVLSAREARPALSGQPVH